MRSPRFPAANGLGRINEGPSLLAFFSPDERTPPEHVFPTARPRRADHDTVRPAPPGRARAAWWSTEPSAGRPPPPRPPLSPRAPGSPRASRPTCAPGTADASPACSSTRACYAACARSSSCTRSTTGTCHTAGARSSSRARHSGRPTRTATRTLFPAGSTLARWDLAAIDARNDLATSADRSERDGDQDCSYAISHGVFPRKFRFTTVSDGKVWRSHTSHDLHDGVTDRAV